MCWMWWSAVLGEMKSRSAICARREPPRRESQHVDLAAGEPARIRGRLPDGASRLAVPGGDEHGTARARLEHALRLEPAKLGGRVVGRERRAVRSLGGQPDVDLRRGQHARSEIVGVGAHALVVAGPVALLVVRARDRVQDGERRRAAQHLLGQHRVKLDAVELRPRERAGLVPDRVRHRRWCRSRARAPRGGASVTSSSASPSTRAASAASSRAATAVPAHVRRLEVDEVGDDGEGVVELVAVQHAVGLGLEGEHGVPRLGLARADRTSRVRARRTGRRAPGRRCGRGDRERPRGRAPARRGGRSPPCRG